MIKSRLFSFVYAFQGIAIVIKTEANMMIHVSMALAVIASALFFNVTTTEWMILLMCIGWVLMAELINTSIEALCDYVTMDEHPKIKLVKDVAAGAVLISAIIASTVGLLIFFPYILLYLQ